MFKEVNVTRTVVSSVDHSAFITVDSQRIVPEGITRFSPGARVEVTVASDSYLVKALQDDHLSVFDAERWVVAR